MQKHVREYLNKTKRQKRNRRRAWVAVALLAVLVVGGVVGILEQYGVAMTGGEPAGSQEEREIHTHGADCYEIRETESLVCGLEEAESAEGHAHGAGCYETREKESLVCGLEEAESAEGHAHGADCYETRETESLVCGLEEVESTEGHAHGADCYETMETESLVCGLEEVEGHVHEAGCYEITETESLICGLEEEEAVEGHAHGADCYETMSTEELVCGLEEEEAVEGHTHGASCYETMSTEELVCGLEEVEAVEGHTHGADCYETMSIEELVCGLEDGMGSTGQKEDIPEIQEAQEPEEDFSDLLTIEELTALPDTVARSTMWRSASFAAAYSLEEGEEGDNAEEDDTLETTRPWSFSAYYVNAEDSYQVTKTDNFNLKYQMEFHTDESIEARKVEIRIPAVLFNYRGTGDVINQPTGDQVRFSAIGVPEGSTSECHESKTTPFNYYIEKIDGTDYVVFFNYKTIAAGTNAAWQVLYKNVEIMRTVDGTEWSLDATAAVTSAEGIAMEGPIWLSGRVDSGVTLESMTKAVHTEADRLYTPGLYTEDQVAGFIDGTLPEKYTADISKWKFVVWEVEIKGRATQPWSLQLLETPVAYVVNEDGTQKEVAGEVVGCRNNTRAGTAYAMNINTEAPFSETATATVISNSTESSWGNKFYIVTAYPAEGIKVGDRLENNLEVRLVPVDSADEEGETESWEDSAFWEYENYDWIYSGNVFKTVKISNPSGTTEEARDNMVYKSWLEAYKMAQKKGADYGSLYFSSSSHIKGYGYTHVAPTIGEDGSIEGDDGTVGSYREGTWYQMVAADDLLYAYPDGKAPVRLTGKDYYFSNVTITQTDRGYDVTEDGILPGPEFKGGVTEKIKDEEVKAGLTIQAVYSTEEGHENDWEDTGVYVDWDPSGTMKYSGSLVKDGRNPWRVRVIHNTLEYRTECTIEVNVCLRLGSPVMEKLLKENADNEDFYLQLKNFSAAMGASYSNSNKDAPSVIGISTDSQEYENNYVKVDQVSSGSGLALADLTREAFGDLYGEADGTMTQFPDRDDANVTLHGLKKEASAFKTASYTNDAEHSRVLVNYRLTAYDGYEVPDQEMANYLKRMEIESPGKKYVMFYDLLPHGVTFDPSVEIIAGRITDLDSNGYYRSQPGRWDTNRVKVSVDTAVDVIDNWNNTGRMMVIFHIEYGGEDSAVYTNGKWIEGWGLSFGAYYDWKDLKSVQNEANISAFMPDIAKYGGEIPGLTGSANDVYPDDGSIVGQNSVYQDFYPNGGNGKINLGNSDSNVRNVIYAHYTVNEENTESSTSGIVKYVRADADIFSAYGETAYVEAGKSYTYETTVTADAGGLKNLVIFDHLENAGAERGEGDPNYGRFGASWTGKLLGVDLAGLEAQGIKPVVWYNADRYAPTTYWEKNGDSLTMRGTEVDPSIILENAPSGQYTDGWYTAEDYIEKYISAHEADAEFQSLSNGEKKAAAVASVGSVAVDLRKSTEKDENGESKDFVLRAQEKVTIRLKMEAPEWTKELAGKSAFNSPHYYAQPATSTGNLAAKRVGDSVRVGIGLRSNLEVLKTLGNESKVPAGLRGKEFTFTLYREDETGKEIPLANREYVLKEWDIDVRDWVSGDTPHSTLADGSFTLEPGQKAVFENVPMEQLESIRVRETADVYWRVEDRCSETMEDDATLVYTHEMVNFYQSVLYLQKDWAGVPQDLTEEEAKTLAETDFTFRLELNGQVGKKVEYCYVDRVALNGSSPKLVDGSAEPDEDGKYHTDDEGQFTIRKGEIIALFIPDADTTYTLTELKASVTETVTQESADGEGNAGKVKVTDTTTDWIIDSTMPAASGTVPQGGAKAVVKNYYRWRDLYLTKRITSQKAEECTESFTFWIKDESGKTITGNKWQLQETDGSLVSQGTEEGGTTQYIGGIIGADGIITAPCAGRVIKIEGLEAGKTYTVEEVDNPEDLYVPLEESKEVWIPTEALSQRVTFVNDYQMRSLSVTKTVVAGTTVDKSFEMIIAKKVAGGTYSYGPFTYSVDGGEAQTAANGHFSLKNGQTAEFTNIGKVGEEFLVWEVADKDYPQLYPIYKEGEASVTAPESDKVGVPNKVTLGTNDSVKFINGTPGTLMLSKEYVAAEGDTPAQTEENEKLAAAIKAQVDRQMQVEKLQDEITLCQYVEGLLCEIVDMSSRMRELTQQGANGTNSPKDRFHILCEIVWLRDEIIRVSEQIDRSDHPWKESVKLIREHSIIEELLSGSELENYIIWKENLKEDDLPEDGWALGEWWTAKLKDIDDFSNLCSGMRATIGGKQNALEKDIEALEDGGISAFDVTVHLTVDNMDWTPTRSDTIFCIDQIKGQVYRIEYNPGFEGIYNGWDNRWEQDPIPPHWSMICLSQYGSAVDWETADSEQAIFGWTENGDFRLKPYMLYVIPLHSEDAVYSVTEVDWNGSQVPEVSGYGTDYTITPQTPEPGTQIGGKVSEEPEAVIRNEVKVAAGSVVEKRMTPDSGPVPVGAKLVWRVERYDAAGEVWRPAEGVEYIVREGRMDGGELNVYTASQASEKTGEDGQIVLRRGNAGNTYLAVKFLKDTVYLNLDDETFANSDIRENGVLRIVEDLEESDREYWGMLVGYGVAGDESEYGNVSYKVARAFVNSNKVMPVEIEKYVEDGSSTEFTMILEQRGIDLSTNREIYLPYEGAAYAVYSPGAEEPEDERSTDAYGRIKLRDGQYVKLYLSPEAVWSVREDESVRPDYLMTALEKENDAKGLLSLQTDGEGQNVVKRMLINLTVSSAEPDETRGYTLTGYDVQNGVINEAGELITLREGEVSIPQFILKNGVRSEVTAIGYGAFKGCSGLTKVTIPNSVTVIGASAFRGSGLTSVEIPAGVKQIADYVFADCEKLSSVTLPDELTAIGDNAFASCSALTEVTIPVTVTGIGKEAFKLTGLTDVTIPEKVTSIGKDAFARCQSLRKIEIKGELDYIAGESNETHDGMFSKSLNLEEIVISGKVKTIYGFEAQLEDGREFGYARLKKITISGQVDSIGEYAFRGCMNLTDVIITGAVDNIDMSAFSRCTSLTNVQLSNTVKVIGVTAFQYCSSLEKIVIPEGVEKIDVEAFSTCTALNKITIPGNVSSIGLQAFAECSSLEEVLISEGVNEIGQNAFQNCTALRKATISAAVIRESAFADCSALKELVMTDGVKEICDTAFVNCTALKEVTIPGTVEAMGNIIFYGCSSLEKIVLQEGIKEIGIGAFAESSALREVILPEGLKSIGNAAFAACNELSVVTLPESLESIEAYAFEGCSSLTQIRIPKKVSKIGERAFRRWEGEGISDVYMEQPYIQISWDAFLNDGIDKKICFHVNWSQSEKPGWPYPQQVWNEEKKEWDVEHYTDAWGFDWSTGEMGWMNYNLGTNGNYEILYNDPGSEDAPEESNP